MHRPEATRFGGLVSIGCLGEGYASGLGRDERGSFVRPFLEILNRVAILLQGKRVLGLRGVADAS